MSGSGEMPELRCAARRAREVGNTPPRRVEGFAVLSPDRPHVYVDARLVHGASLGDRRHLRRRRHQHRAALHGHRQELSCPWTIARNSISRPHAEGSSLAATQTVVERIARDMRRIARRDRHARPPSAVARASRSTPPPSTSSSSRLKNATSQQQELMGQARELLQNYPPDLRTACSWSPTAGGGASDMQYAITGPDLDELRSILRTVGEDEKDSRRRRRGLLARLRQAGTRASKSTAYAPAISASAWAISRRRSTRSSPDR